MTSLQPESDRLLIEESALQSILQRSTLMVSSAEINRAIVRLADELNQRFRGEVPLLMCVMHGGLIFTGHLMPRLSIFCELDFLHTSRYRQGTRGGALDWRIKPNQSLQHRRIILIDDVFDEGQTLAQISDYCLEKGALEVFSVVLFDKIHDRKIPDFEPDLVGVTVDDHFLVGFGMDYAGYFRHLPDVYALRLEEDEDSTLQ